MSKLRTAKPSPDFARPVRLESTRLIALSFCSFRSFYGFGTSGLAHDFRFGMRENAMKCDDSLYWYDRNPSLLRFAGSNDRGKARGYVETKIIEKITRAVVALSLSA